MQQAQPNQFQYILNIRGIDTEILANAPEGWLNTNITYKKSQSYMGLFRSLSFPQKFVNKGAYLLRKEFYNYGVQAFVKDIIKQQYPYTWGYNQIYAGRLDFSTAVDELTSFTVNSISDDFSVQLNANESTKYAIPLDVDAAVNIELTPLALKEQADLIFNTSPDFRSHAFFEMGVANNQQNSVNNSVQQTGFLAYTFPATPVFDNTQPNWFYEARTDTNVHLSGSIQSSVNSGHYQFNIYKTGGTLVRTLSEVTNSVTLQNNFSWDFVIRLNQGERLFFYIDRLDSPNTFQGVNMQAGTMHLEYTTISPATMCKALSASYVFGQLLQAMNTNTDSGPNQPVPYQSLLLNGLLTDLMITSSDSIKLATGSISREGDTLFPGTYKVLSGSILYGSQTYGTNAIFPYIPDTLTFTGSGIVEKILSGFVGTVYNPMETLQAGGTYLVGGNIGTFVTYNAVNYSPGQEFSYILGQETFTGSDDTSFVEQVGIAAQLILSFKDFFQSIYSVMGGNCAFGIESIPNPDITQIATVPTVGRCFIESLDYIYRATIGSLNAGTVDTAIKIQPASDLIPNTIKVGYNDQQYSQLNGYFEVNSTQNYLTTIVNPKKELNLISIIRADPYGIEEIRVSQNDTAASRSDNDNFFIYKKDAPEATSPFTYYHPLRTETLNSITGVDPSYYNWILSPKQNLLRGGPFLASVFYNMKGYSIKLSAALKNTGMVTIDNTGRRVAEADPLLISSLPKPLFIPVYATFKPGLVNGAMQMIDNVPYGFIKFTYNGQEYKMFADSISVDIGQNTQQEFKGLLTPGNDLTTLIH